MLNKLELKTFTETNSIPSVNTLTTPLCIYKCKQMTYSLVEYVIQKQYFEHRRFVIKTANHKLLCSYYFLNSID